MKILIVLLAILGLLQTNSSYGDDGSIKAKMQNSPSLNLSITALLDNSLTLQDYSRQCGEIIGANMPSFSCMSGTEIPVALTATARGCEKPALLGDGSCVTGQRIGNIAIPGKPEVQIAYICRKYDSGMPVEEFNDIAVIHHNRDSGATCWYQSDTRTYRDGTSVPSPVEGTANGLWLSPMSVGPGNINCSNCHMADPFIHTPFVTQTKQVPSNPLGKYWNYQFPVWDEFKIVEFHPGVSNNCTNCHRIPVDKGRSCEKFNRNAVGLGGDAAWMPTQSPTIPQLHAAQNDYDELQDCCSNGTGCNKVSFTRKPPATLEITEIISARNYRLRARLSDVHDLSAPIRWTARELSSASRQQMYLGTSEHDQFLQTEMNCTTQHQRVTVTARATLHDGTTVSDSMEAICRKPDVSVSYADPGISGTVSEAGKVIINRDYIRVGDLFEPGLALDGNGLKPLPVIFGNTTLSVEHLGTLDSQPLDISDLDIPNRHEDTAIRGFLSFPTYPVANATGIESAKLILSLSSSQGYPFRLADLNLVHVNYGDILDGNDFNDNRQLLRGLHHVANAMPAPRNASITVDVTDSVVTAWNARRQIGNRVQFRLQFKRLKEVNRRSDHVQIMARYQERDGSINFNLRRPYLEITYKR